MMDYWDRHGWLFLLGMTFVPRLAMLIAVTVPFGWLAWLGWLLVPSFLAAVLATTHYWDTNPFLCVLAWLVLLAKLEETGRRS